MSYPPLVKHPKEDDYRQHFRDKYCKKSIMTFDGIPVRFAEKDFGHAFYESRSSTQPTKDMFSIERAERIDWIEAALLDNNASLHYGWDSKKKKVNAARRVAIANGNYVVVIQIMKSGKARFVTAFPASASRTVLLIGASPKWQQP